MLSERESTETTHLNTEQPLVQETWQTPEPEPEPDTVLTLSRALQTLWTSSELNMKLFQPERETY